MTHTPKPWTRDNLIITDFDGTRSVMIWGPEGPGMGRVAQVYDECGGGLLDNANLIEAAPDMYDLLFEWKRNALWEASEEWVTWVEDFGTRVDAAIRKARGSEA